MTTHSLLARQHDLKREAGGRYPIKVISLLVWSSRCPGAAEVGVEFKRYALGGIMAISVAAGGYGALILSRGKRL